MNNTISLGDPRHAAATRVLEAMHEYFELDPFGGAVRWMEDTSGRALIFTRGEYRQTLFKNVDDLGIPVSEFEQRTLEREGYELEPVEVPKYDAGQLRRALMRRLVKRADARESYDKFIASTALKHQPSLLFWWYMLEVKRDDGSFPKKGDDDFVAFESWWSVAVEDGLYEFPGDESEFGIRCGDIGYEFAALP